jgi:hypothetical protein
MAQIKNRLSKLGLNSSYTLALVYSYLTSGMMCILTGLSIYISLASDNIGIIVLSITPAFLLFMIDNAIINSLLVSNRRRLFLVSCLKVVVGINFVLSSHNFIENKIFDPEIRNIIQEKYIHSIQVLKDTPQKTDKTIVPSISFLQRLDALEQLKKTNNNVQTISYFIFTMLLIFEFLPFVLLLSFLPKKLQLPKPTKNPFSDGIASSFDLFGGTFGKEIEPIADFDTKRGFYKDREAFKNDYVNVMGDMKRSFNKLKAELEYE